MPKQIQFGSKAYNVPLTGEESAEYWTGITDFLSDVPGSVFQTGSGLFELTQEVDFGSLHGVRALYWRSRSGNEANTGTVRLNKDDFLAWRSEDNTQDISLGKDSDDFLTFNTQRLLVDPTTTEGDLVTRNGAGILIRLPKGTDGQVLTSTPTGIAYQDLPEVVPDPQIAVNTAAIATKADQSSLNTTNSNVSANTSAISSNSSNIAANTTAIAAIPPPAVFGQGFQKVEQSPQNLAAGTSDVVTLTTPNLPAGMYKLTAYLSMNFGHWTKVDTLYVAQGVSTYHYAAPLTLPNNSAPFSSMHYLGLSGVVSFRLALSVISSGANVDKAILELYRVA